MTNFPFFQHYAIKMVFQKEIMIDEKLVDKIASLLVETLKLNVVNQGKYEFTNNGLTKFWILSQSHLVIHSWPENNAIHIDLMTCSLLPTTAETIEKCLEGFSTEDMVVTALEY